MSNSLKSVAVRLNPAQLKMLDDEVARTRREEPTMTSVTRADVLRLALAERVDRRVLKK